MAPVIKKLLDGVDGANTGDSLDQYGGTHSVHVNATSWAGNAKVTIQVSADGGTTWLTLTHYADDHPAVYIGDGANLLSPCGQGVLIRAISSGTNLVGCTVRLIEAPLV